MPPNILPLRYFLLYIFITYFTWSHSNFLFSQSFHLELLTKDKKHSDYLNKIAFKKLHQSKKSIQNETNLISKKLQLLGFFTNQIDSITKKDSVFTCFFSLNKKINTAIIHTSKKFKETLEISKNDSIIQTKTELIPSLLKSISEKLDNNGNSFSQAKLKNIHIQKDTLFADLTITPSKKRTIDEVIIKGYNKLSNKYLNRFLKINLKKTVFSKKKATNISKAIQNNPFIKETKPSNVLFSNDSTFLYLYLKEKKGNTINGSINLSSKDDKLEVNGDIFLSLKNIFHSGEEINLKWISNNDRTQSFKISNRIPYIFNSNISSDFSFSIFKQDSSFLNTNFKGTLSYYINHYSELGLTFNSENSDITNDDTNKNIKSFDKKMFGIIYRYSIIDDKNIEQNKFHLAIQPSFGKRKSGNTKQNQMELKLDFSYLIELSERYFLSTSSSLLNLESSSLLDNELFQTSFLNSITPSFFNTNSSRIFYSNLKYIILFNNKDYIYPFSEIFILKKRKKHKSTLGFGYQINKKNTKLNIGISSIIYQQQSFSLNTPFVFFKTNFNF